MRNFKRRILTVVGLAALRLFFGCPLDKPPEGGANAPGLLTLSVGESPAEARPLLPEFGRLT